MLLRIALASTTVHPAERVVVEQWTTAEGLPLDHVNDLEIGEDGRLWIATFEGLWTWDGATMQPVPSHIADVIGSVRLLLVRRHPIDGSLWVLTEDHSAVRIAEGKARRLTLDDGPDSDVRAFDLLRHGGNLWIRTNRGLYVIGDTVEHAYADTVQEPVLGLGWSKDESMWVGHRTSVLRVSPDGHVDRFDQRHGLPPRIFTLHGLRDGRPWVFAENGALDEGYAFDGERFVPSRGFMSGPVACAATRAAGPSTCPPDESPDTSPWLVHEHGVLFEGKEVLTTQLPIQVSLQDPSGALWLATEGEGLYRLSRSAVEWTPPPPEDPRVTRLWRAASGQLWAYTPGVHWWTRIPIAIRSLQILEEGLPPHPYLEYLFSGPDGATWGVGRNNRPVRLGALSTDGPTPAWTAPEGDLAQARASVQVGGAVLVAMGNGVARGDDTGWRAVEGSPEQRACFAIADLEPDRVVTAVYGSGLQVIADGRFEPGVATDRVAYVRHLRKASSGLWVSTEDQGLCVITDTTGPAESWDVRCLSRDALPANGAHMSVPDGLGRVWVGTNRGLAVFEERALDAFAKGGPSPHAIVLGKRNGLPNPETNGGNDRVMLLDEDGVLSVATQDGVVHVNTRTFTMPEAPVAKVAARHTASGAPATLLSLEPAHAPVKLSWWATDLDWGDQILFRTRMRGSAWSEPTTSRSMTLAEVPAGDSVLEVQAGLGSQWGPVATVPIRRRHRLSEHPLTPVAVLLLGAVGMAMLAWYRQRMLARRAREMEDEVASKTRTLLEQSSTLARQRDQIAEQRDEIAKQRDEITRQRDELAEQRDEIEGQARMLEDLDEQKSRMIVNLHHELRTPLTLVLGPLRDAWSAGHNAEIGLALRNAERLEQLVGQLAQIAHMEAGTTRLSASWVDMGHFSRRCTERFLAMAREREIQLDVVTGLGDLSVFADLALMEDALGNLLHNALKFSPRGRRIQVSVRGAPDSVVVEVWDEGIGVPEEHRERIFDRMYQVDRDDDRSFEGTGLGLALAREVIELHGGTIHHRPNPDGGSVFWFSVPVGSGHLAPEEINVSEAARPNLHAPPEAIESVEPQPSDLPLVLVVEDHADMRAYITSILSEGHRVITASNGTEGIAAARQHRPAVVVSDVMMPGMDGMRMTRAFRDDPDLRDTPIVLVTAKTKFEDRIEGLELADAWLDKPFHTSELRAHVHRLCRRSDRAATPPDPARGHEPDLPTADRALLDRLQEALHARLSDQELRVDELARSVGMSARTLQRELARIEGGQPEDLDARAAPDSRSGAAATGRGQDLERSGRRRRDEPRLLQPRVQGVGGSTTGSGSPLTSRVEGRVVVTSTTDRHAG